MSPNTVFRPDALPDNPIAEHILRDPRVAYDVDGDTLVFAIRSELIVHRVAREGIAPLHAALTAIARPCGTLASLEGGPVGKQARDGSTIDPASVYRPADDGPAGDVELWRLDDPARNSIDEARRLNRLAPQQCVTSPRGPELMLPAVSPNHACIVSPRPTGCPAGPPHPAPMSGAGEGFVPEPDGAPGARIAVIDTGYIVTDPPHETLDARVEVRPGESVDSATIPATWVPDAPDEVDTDAEGRLYEIVGHGTFIAGLIAHLSPAARITAVEQRGQDIEITGLDGSEQVRLFSSELAVAHSLLLYSDTEVVQCGFSFPTLDDYPSVPFAAAMQVLTGPDAPRPGIAVVAPAGNEESPRRYWPAALPDVIGVAATNRRATARAHFSNWGPWVDCCTRGEDIFSTYIYFSGPVEGDRLDDVETFTGWARWDGTSFAAPQVSAAIASILAATDEAITPVEAFELLLAGLTPYPVDLLTDYALSGFPGVTLPLLSLGG